MRYSLREENSMRRLQVAFDPAIGHQFIKYARLVSGRGPSS